MTKVQLKNEVLNTLVAKKANKALTEAITELLELYTKTSNKDTVKRAKVIEVDGITYVWCNRHEFYEPETNFKTQKSAECKLGTKHWSNLTKQVHELEGKLTTALDQEDYEAAGTINRDLKALKETRGGRYSFEANKLQYPELEGYDYEVEHFITEEVVA